MYGKDLGTIAEQSRTIGSLHFQYWFSSSFADTEWLLPVSSISLQRAGLKIYPLHSYRLLLTLTGWKINDFQTNQLLPAVTVPWT